MIMTPKLNFEKSWECPPGYQSPRTFILSRRFGIATRPSTPLLTPKLAKYDGDISKCQVHDNLLPDNIKQLRDTYSNVYKDYKTALYYLALQRKETK